MKIKKVAALALAAVMGTSMLAGCASKSINEDAVVVKMKDGEVRLGVANFMARYTQYTYDSIYGSYFKDDYWSQDMSGKGKTMEEEVKSQVMDSLKTYYALAAHADDYGVKITKDDQKKIEKAAKKFISDNSKDAVDGDECNTGRCRRVSASCDDPAENAGKNRRRCQCQCQ